MSVRKRWVLFFFGLFFVALGISCIVKSMLGTAPISSMPYVLSLRYHLSLGFFTFVFNMLFLFMQILILRRKFQYLQLLQIPITGIFGFFIDFTACLLNLVMPEMYISKLIVLLVGIVILALGVTMEIIGDVVVLPGEGIVNTIAAYWHFNFGTTKTCFDTGTVFMAGMFSWFFFGEIQGVREGTLIAALATGFIAKFFLKHLSYMDEHGKRIFRSPFAASQKESYQCR